MSAAKHTPGPWVYFYKSKYDEHHVSVPSFGPAAMNLALFEDGIPTKNAADACLIAAAPDLLAALRKALDDSGCDGDLCMYEWHEIARAAIAKAEGQL